VVIVKRKPEKRSSTIPREVKPPSFTRQIALHEASKRELDVRKTMAAMKAIIEETARWDVVRGIDPLERWRRRRDKEAQAKRDAASQ